MDISFDFSDVDRWFKEEEFETKRTIEDIVIKSLNFAKRTKTYKNRTYNMINSYGYEMDGYSPTIYNKAYYASFVEAKGYDVLGLAALWLEDSLRKEFK